MYVIITLTNELDTNEYKKGLDILSRSFVQKSLREFVYEGDFSSAILTTLSSNNVRYNISNKEI